MLKASAFVFFCVAFLWLLFSYFALPSIIEAAYFKHGPFFLNNIISGQAEHSLDYYLNDAASQRYPALLFILFLWVCGLVILKNQPLTLEHLAGKATPEDLGWVRIVVCFATIIYVLSENTTSVSLLPVELRNFDAMGVMPYLYRLPVGLEHLAQSRLGLQILKSAVLVFLFLGLVGLKTRFVIPLAFLGDIILGGIHREFTHFFHSGLLPIYLLAVLSVTPCADGLSLDRFIAIRKESGRVYPNQPSRRYGYARFACWSVFALTYFFVGLSKFRNGGFYWWNAQHIKYFILTDSLNLIEFDFNILHKFYDLPDFVFNFFGIAGSYIEVMVILVLFSFWARKVFPFVIIALHVGIWGLQEFIFADLLVLPMLFLGPPLVNRIKNSKKSCKK